jgi:dUTP pyrophosphatase
MNIPIKISRVDKNFPLPEYQTTGSVAFDMYSRTNAIIAPNEIALLPSNLIIVIPEGYALLTTPRSSIARKKGLIFPNSAGIIDQDYHGPNDEIDIPVEITAGERIGQGLIVPITRATWIESDEFFSENRGGFGSTGGYVK